MATEFNNVLNQYKASLLEYKVTGKTAFKQQAEVAEKWLKDYITTLDQTVQRDADYIDRFAKNYEKTNPELMRYAKEIEKARTEGPKLQDAYEGEKISQEESPLNEYMYYTKAAVIGGILALGAVVSFL